MELLRRMHKRIGAARTGTPTEFAAVLHINKRRLYDIIDELKDIGAPIVYSRLAQTYSYSKDFDMENVL
jgi:plasmid maintenance system antidote protein VapI